MISDDENCRCIDVSKAVSSFTPSTSLYLFFFVVTKSQVLRLELCTVSTGFNFLKCRFFLVEGRGGLLLYESFERESG